MPNDCPTLEVPEPRRTVALTMRDGAIIRLRQHGNPDGPRIVLSHGNGFAIDAYLPFWSRLAEEFELILYDQRNHGQNPYHGSPGHHIDGFAGDLAQLLEEIPRSFGPKPAFGAFHSVSAITALVHACAHGLRWEGLVLFDPPLVPTHGEPLHARARRSELFLAGWAMGRQAEFADPGELAEQLRGTRAMQGWVAGAHELMARCVLRRGEEGWQLACRRELEAAIYIANGYSRVWDGLAALVPFRDRILILSADPEPEGAKYPALVAQRVREELGLEVRPIAGTTHMLQIERPQACAEALADFLRRF